MLAETRPTAVNLRWAVERMLTRAAQHEARRIGSTVAYTEAQKPSPTRMSHAPRRSAAMAGPS